MVNKVEVKELIEERLNTLTEARSIVDKAHEEKRGLTAEESANHAKAMQHVADLKSRIDAEVSQSKIEDEQRSLEDELNEASRKPINVSEERGTLNPTLNSDEYRTAFDKYLRTGDPNYVSEYRDEFRAIGSTDPVAPVAVFNQVIEKVSRGSIIRNLATVLTILSDTDFPVEQGPGTSTWLAERDLAAGTEPTLQRLALKAHKLGRLIKVPNEVVADEQINLTQYLANAIARTNSDLEEQAFVGGNGTTRPTGFIVDATQGAVSTEASLASADLLNLRRSLATQYRANAVMMASDGFIGFVEGLRVDTPLAEVPIFQPGTTFGQDDRILGVRLVTNPWMFSSTGPVLAYGDFSAYYIVDRAQSMVIKRSAERFFDSDETAYLGLQRVDGALTDSDAVKTLLLT